MKQDDNDNLNNNYIDYGFKKVKSELKTSKIQKLFNDVSNKYDIMNDFMSFNLHRVWKKNFVNKIIVPNNAKILDLAGGTGDIALNFLKYKNFSKPDITICDLSEEMMQIGKNKAYDRGFFNIKWVNGDAQTLPFKNESFDLVVIAFGLRNVAFKQKALDEIKRVLKTDGLFYCLEFSMKQSHSLNKVYDFYSFNVIPKIGKLVANDEESYQYLVESIRTFPKALELKEMILKAGFSNCDYEFSLDGIVATHKGF